MVLSAKHQRQEAHGHAEAASQGDAGASAPGQAAQGHASAASQSHAEASEFQDWLWTDEQGALHYASDVLRMSQLWASGVEGPREADDVSDDEPADDAEAHDVSE